MICQESAGMLNALVDGELDAGHARDVEVHVARCARCAAQLESLRNLRQALKESKLRYSAPASLRLNVARRISPPISTERRTLLKGFALGSLLSATAAASLSLLLVRGASDDVIIREAVSAHLRSLQAEHLTDVLSSDRHTVKPWFNGRIDLAPPVIDLTAQGFTLLGGRLDYIDGKPVAAIVYRRRVHVINLFVAQQTTEGARKPQFAMVQGFNVCRWSSEGLDLTVVSDLNRDELEEFTVKFETAARGAEDR